MTDNSSQVYKDEVVPAISPHVIYYSSCFDYMGKPERE